MRVQDDLAEKMQSEVTLHDVDLAALQLLVDFAYSGQILITEDNVQVSHINWMILQTLENNSQKHINHTPRQVLRVMKRTSVLKYIGTFWDIFHIPSYLLCVLD
jgi:BTB/POZ domain